VGDPFGSPDEPINNHFQMREDLGSPDTS